LEEEGGCYAAGETGEEVECWGRKWSVWEGVKLAQVVVYVGMQGDSRGCK